MLFTELGLSPEALHAIDDLGFSEATEIQSKAIPVMLSGADLIGRSNTGTGKTAAFGLPLIERIDRGDRSVQALILCPTRELAMQACEELNKFSKYMPWVKTAAVYGGASMDRQISALKRGANIVVGTPGRVMDHMDRRTLKLENLRTIVLDEADEMLNMGFREDIEQILGAVPEERQTVLFSATMPPAILAITDLYQHDPVMIKVENKTRTVESVEQYYYEVPMGRKNDALKLLLAAYEPKLSMVFCNTKKMVDELSESLVSGGFKAAGLHGDMKQQSRTQVLNAFKSGRINILIATDVAARGIDVDNVDAVFNYDIPQDNEYYIHRIGRTGRAGKSGKAYTLVSGRRQVYELRDISRFTKADIAKRDLPDRSEIVEKKISRVSDKVISAINENKYPESRAYLDGILSQGYSAEDVAAALIGMRLSKDVKNIPEFVKSLPRDFGRGKTETVKLEISVGRRNRIAPNFILGALADITNLPGKAFGKIDIYDNYSTVEVPADEKDSIIEVMNGQKINGQRVTVKLYDVGRRKEPRRDFGGKGGRNDRGNRRGGRDDRRHDRTGRSYSNKNKRHQ
ncbi:MAG: DEAD/DEAH box helicase [Oscillospiraceae bacterium]|nr:DEAD/DEAH box helicase [Oscillospiraceae bacterium]